MTEKYFDFELVEERQIEELNTRGRLYRHKKTGAQFLSLSNDDENKVFAITFRTTLKTLPVWRIFWNTPF